METLNKQKTIGGLIRSERTRQGLTQDELATRCGYKHKSAISKIENCGNNISGKKLRLMSEALGVPIGELYNAVSTADGEYASEVEAMSSESVVAVNVCLTKAICALQSARQVFQECFPDVFQPEYKWMQLSDTIRAKRGYKCQRCGKENTTLHVHHIRPTKYGFPKICDEKWLAVLCQKCHLFVHSKKNTSMEFIALPEGETL